MEQLNRRETVEVLNVSVVLRRNWTATLAPLLGGAEE
jgi:hypothetical protein